MAFAHALKIALVAEAGLEVLHVSERRDLGWTDFPRVRAMLERWRVLPPNSPRNAVASIGIEVRKVVMKDSDPVRAADAAALFLPYGCEGFISQADGSASLRNVLLPIDSEPSPEPALEAARRLTWALQCPEVTFTLLHVGGPGEMPSVRIEEQPGWTWRKVTRDGEVVDTILAVAGECAADLIVMTTAGRHGFLDALRGSTTERVLRSGVAPLLAIPQAARV